MFPASELGFPHLFPPTEVSVHRSLSLLIFIIFFIVFKPCCFYLINVIVPIRVLVSG